MESGPLRELRTRVCASAARFDASALDRDAAVAAVEEWSAIVNAAEAACAMAAARLDECGPPPSAGARTAEDFVARTTGTTAAKARRRVRVGKGLQAHTRTREWATAGRLSGEQTEAITEARDAATEASLLEVAGRASLCELRQEAARLRALGENREQAEQRIHCRRSLRRWREPDGTEHLHASGTVMDMAAIDRALAPLVDDAFDQARKSGTRESHDAYLFDALVALARRGSGDSGHASRRESMRYLTLVHVDLAAVVRGVVKPNERCEIPGVGPISVTAARDLLSESIVKLVVTKGVDVCNVTHLGRGPTVAQKIALLWQQPHCSREGCPNRALIEVDHRVDWAATHHTQLDELDHLCWHDHDLKTRHGWALVDGTGRRPMVAPDHPDHPRNRPPPGGP